MSWVDRHVVYVPWMADDGRHVLTDPTWGSKPLKEWNRTLSRVSFIRLLLRWFVIMVAWVAWLFVILEETGYWLLQSAVITAMRGTSNWLHASHIKRHISPWHGWIHWTCNRHGLLAIKLYKPAYFEDMFWLAYKKWCLGWLEWCADSMLE